MNQYPIPVKGLTPQEAYYVKKLNQIVSIISSKDIEYTYTDIDGEACCFHSVPKHEAIPMAEKILSKMGYNKPKKLTQ